ncbi:MAG: hypothetical protein RSA63_02700 [Eubacterium sp.]
MIFEVDKHGGGSRKIGGDYCPGCGQKADFHVLEEVKEGVQALRNKRYQNYEPYGHYYDARDDYERNGFKKPKPVKTRAKKVLERNKNKHFMN